MGDVGSGVGSLYVLRFRASLGAKNVNQVTIDGSLLKAPVMGTGTTPDARDVAPTGSPYAWTATRTQGTDTSSTNEVQVVQVEGATGHYTLIFSYAGHSYETALIDPSLPAAAEMAAIQSALTSLSVIQAADVQVGQLDTGAYYVRFTGAYAGQDLPALQVGGDANVLAWTFANGTTSAVINQIQTVAVSGPTGGTFTLAINLPGTQVTATLPIGASADQVENALQLALLNTRFALDIVVTSYAGPTGATVYVISFEGVLAQGVSGRRNPLLTATAAGGASVAIDTLTSGLQYFGVDNLNIDMGSGVDVVNVRSTSATTTINTDAAGRTPTSSNPRENIYVSSDAWLDARTQYGYDYKFNSRDDVDLLSGNLDGIQGALNIDAGVGANRLMVSDEAATVADTNVVITDRKPTALGGMFDSADIWVTGLAPAGISYKATGGDFTGGVTYWTGRGGDSIAIDGTDTRSGTRRTVTTLNTGDGNDTVNVSLNTADGFFVLNTQNGDDTVRADAANSFGVASTLPLVIFGGLGNDTIRSGEGNDIVVGDLGRVWYRDGTGNDVARLGGGGPGDRTDGSSFDPYRVFNSQATLTAADANDGMPRGVGGDDVIFGNRGDALLLGGGGDDAVDGGRDSDLILGDNADLTRKADATSLRYRTLSGTKMYDANGNPVLDAVAQVQPGGSAWWAFYTLTLRDHSDGATDVQNYSGADYLAGGAGDDMIFGELGSDVIQGDGSIDVALTNGLRVFAIRYKATNAFSGNPSFDATGDGSDYVEGGGGNDAIFGDGGQDDLI